MNLACCLQKSIDKRPRARIFCPLMKFWQYGLVVLGALALGLGTIVFSDYMRPSKRLERKQQKHEEMIRVAQEKEKLN